MLHYLARNASRCATFNRPLTLLRLPSRCNQSRPLGVSQYLFRLGPSRATCLPCSPRRSHTWDMGIAEADAMPASLEAAEDSYDGIVISAEHLPRDADTFEELLAASLDLWRRQRRKGVWLKIPIDRAVLINSAVEAGFIFHHAETSYVMLTLWLPATESTLPANASHQVGVGAFVLNEHEQVLVVQEAHGPLRGKSVWKMPTGLVNAMEDVPLAAVREVLEETGIRSSFSAILACRQAHGFGMGRNKSDMFFVVALRPELGQVQVVPQDSELEAAKWMPLHEFGELQFLRQRPLHSMILDRCLAYAQGTYAGLQGYKVGGGLRMEKELLLTGPLDGHSEHENASRL